MSAVARWRLVALLGVAATLVAASIAPKSLVATQLAYFLVLFALIIPLHELGHAIAGAMVGYRIMNISVGAGPLLAGFRVFGVNVQINLLPLGGLTAAYAKRTYGWTRLRQWILIAGGPAANVAIFFGLRKVLGAGLHDGEHHPIASTAYWVNWTLLLINLIPFRSPDGTMSDGYGLFTIPFWSAKQVQEAHARSWAMRIIDAIKREDVVRAHQLLEEARARYPESALIDLVTGSLLHRERRHEAALAAWREGLTKAPDPKLTAMFKNSIAFVLVVLGRDEDLPEADRLSLEALSVFPELPPIMGTRGAVLLRLRRPAEALLLLLPAEAVALDARNKAYDKALVAGALAGVGRGEEAVRKLAEARQLDPDCDLIPRAEAEIAAGPLPVTAPPAGTSPAANPTAFAAALRIWRRDARVVAFASTVALAQAGVNPFAFVILIVVSIAPDLGGVIAMAAYGLSTGLLHATGLLRRESFAGPASRGTTTAIALAVAATSIWLIARHRRLGAVPPSKASTVLAWILAGIAAISLLPALFPLTFNATAVGLHMAARTVIAEAPLLIALAALLATRRRRGVRPLALAPAALAACALVVGSELYLNRVALADVPVHGLPVTWRAPVPAKAIRSAQFTAAGVGLTVSPGGRAFFVVSPGLPTSRNGRSILHVGDFDGHVVQVAGAAGAFIDDDRLLVLRPGATRKDAHQLVELRPFKAPEPTWIKEIDDADFSSGEIRFHRATGTVFMVGPGTNGPPEVFRTTVDPNTPVTAPLIPHQEGDEFFAATLPLDGPGSLLVGRGTGFARDLIWRSPGEERRLGARWSFPTCVATPAGAEIIWCFTHRSPILYRVDSRVPHLTRVPGEIEEGWQHELLAPSLLAIFDGDDLEVLDLETRRGARLTLPEGNGHRLQLAKGALATLARPDAHAPGGTVVVYQNPLE